MATGDKRPVVMEADMAKANGLATLGSDGILALAQRPTVSGIKSDDGSKTLDELLSGKAPAGYGYGELPRQFIYTDDTDGSKFEAGIQSFITGMPTSRQYLIAFQSYPFIDTASFHGTIVRTGSAVTLQGTDYYGTSIQRVYDDSSGWKPWEWVNPPMRPNVEYRTTERYLGKPVYKKLVSLGKVVAGNNSILGFVTDLGAIYFKSISVHLGPVATPLFAENSLSGWFSAYITTISDDLNFYVGGGFANYDAYAFAEYIKELI